MNLYDTLDVPQDADQTAIKFAYRKKAQMTHPDKGGDEKAFHAIQVAYDVLSDDDRRQRYDSTGEVGPIQDKKAYARNAIAATLMALIDQKDVTTTDLVAVAKSNVTAYILGLNNQKRDIERKIKSRQVAVDRLTGPADGMMQDVIRGDIKSHEQGIAKIELEIERSKDVLLMLDDYSYRSDPMPQQSQYNQNQQNISQNMQGNRTRDNLWELSRNQSGTMFW